MQVFLVDASHILVSALIDFSYQFILILLHQTLLLLVLDLHWSDRLKYDWHLVPVGSIFLLLRYFCTLADLSSFWRRCRGPLVNIVISLLCCID